MSAEPNRLIKGHNWKRTKSSLLIGQVQSGESWSAPQVLVSLCVCSVSVYHNKLLISTLILSFVFSSLATISRCSLSDTQHANQQRQQTLTTRVEYCNWQFSLMQTDNFPIQFHCYLYPIISFLALRHCLSEQQHSNHFTQMWNYSTTIRQSNLTQPIENSDNYFRLINLTWASKCWPPKCSSSWLWPQVWPCLRLAK